jgi:mannan endo-1,4-beta-mannosidase
MILFLWALALLPSGLFAKMPLPTIQPKLCNAQASSQAKGLLSYLGSQYGNHVLAGQTNLGDANWILEQTGKKPALVGFDMMDYSPSRVARGATCTDIEQALVWGKAGGIVQFQWHWNAPDDLIDTEGKEWWRGFYTNASHFDLAAAMADKDSKEFKHLLRDMDAIALKLKILQDAGIPVLWRPLHEAEGGWFWWGAKGAGPCKELYRLLYDRLTNFHGLNNLIWVWVSSTNPTALDWYPGDDVVDVIGADIYAPKGDHGPLAKEFKTLVSLFKGTKMVALTENGAIPDPEQLKAQKAGWAWFMTWGGNFARDGIQNSKPALQATYHSPYVVTQEQLPLVMECPR